MQNQIDMHKVTLKWEYDKGYKEGSDYWVTLYQKEKCLYDRFKEITTALNDAIRTLVLDMPGKAQWNMGFAQGLIDREAHFSKAMGKTPKTFTVSEYVYAFANIMRSFEGLSEIK